MRNPRDFFKPLAIDAPEPIREVPVRPSRMIHFLDFSNEKMVAKAPDIAPQVDILLGNLEDAIPVDRKEAAREGLIQVGSEIELGETQLWTRVNALESPWVLDDLTAARRRHRRPAGRGDGPEGRGRLGHPLRGPPARAAGGEGGPRPADPGPRDPGDGAGRDEPRGDRHRQPAHAGDELRPRRPRRQPAHEDDPRGRRPPGLPRDRGPGPGQPGRAARRRRSRTRGTTRSRAWWTPAPAPASCPSTGPYGDIKDTEGCETQFRAAFLLGCVGAWSLHPAQIDIAKKVFSPDPDEVKFAKKVIEAIPDGRGVHMIDGKMQDDATWKQCKVMVDLAEMLARKDPELAEAYELEPAARVVRCFAPPRVGYVPPGENNAESRLMP